MRAPTSRPASNFPQAIVFDFDGVLVNSEPLHFQAFQEVAADEKIELTETEYYNELIGFDDQGAWKHLFALHNKEADSKTMLRVMARKLVVMRDLISRRQYKSLPGVSEFVRGLWRNYPLAICSGALREEIETMLEGISLRDCFSTIIPAEEVTVGKPDPQGYLLATKRIADRIGLPLAPVDVLVIEDAPKVIQEATKVGFRVLGVTNTHPAERLAASGAEWVVPALQVPLVKKLLPTLRMFER